MNEIKYNEEKIPYTITKAKIKNLYIHIKDGQVIVKAPIRLKEKHIQDFLEKKSKWIYENLKKYEQTSKVEEKIEAKDVERLKSIIEETIQKYSKTLGKVPNKVRIRDIKYAWGSCSSKKNITINLKLALKEQKIIEYVVLHEMCHLIEMNHSKTFWDLVEKNMPNYKIYRTKLKKY